MRATVKINFGIKQYDMYFLIDSSEVQNLISLFTTSFNEINSKDVKVISITLDEFQDEYKPSDHE